MTNENCTVLIPKGNSYCRRKSSAGDQRHMSKVTEVVAFAFLWELLVKNLFFVSCFEVRLMYGFIATIFLLASPRVAFNLLGHYKPRNIIYIIPFLPEFHSSFSTLVSFYQKNKWLYTVKWKIQCMWNKYHIELNHLFVQLKNRVYIFYQFTYCSKK